MYYRSIVTGDVSGQVVVEASVSAVAECTSYFVSDDDNRTGHARCTIDRTVRDSLVRPYSYNRQQVPFR